MQRAIRVTGWGQQLKKIIIVAYYYLDGWINWTNISAGLVAGGLIFLLPELFGFGAPMPVRIITLLGYLISELLDVVSTYKTVSLIPRYRARGWEFPYYETNPLLPDLPEPSEIFWGKPTQLMLLLVPLAVFYPAFGMGVIIAKLLTAGSNLHGYWVLHKRLGKGGSQRHTR